MYGEIKEQPGGEYQAIPGLVSLLYQLLKANGPPGSLPGSAGPHLAIDPHSGVINFTVTFIIDSLVNSQVGIKKGGWGWGAGGVKASAPSRVTTAS